MTNRIVISLAVLLGVTQVGSTQQLAAANPANMRRHYVEQLRLESRLPEWANYVCSQDAMNVQSGLFMLIGYQASTNDTFFPNDAINAKEFGYRRGLTYQEYIGSDADITPINMPISPEEFSEEMPKGVRGQAISSAAIDMLWAESTTLHNAIAVAKNTVRQAAKYPSLESKLLKDEEVQALLDAPDGTNFHNYLDKHPGYTADLFYRQKYYNAGLVDPPKGFKVYREGNVIFENDFGSDVFQSVGSGGKSDGDKPSDSGLATRIEMEDTASGLRFLESHSLRGSGIGIPTTGKCDSVTTQ